MMENSFLIKTKDLVKTYPVGHTTLFALNRVSLGFKPGEFAGLVGPSGSGKTTFLNIVGSLASPVFNIDLGFFDLIAHSFI